jgi:ABC-type polysaccharide/polyol phosphate export permease
MLNPISSILIYSIVFKLILKQVAVEGNPSGLKSFTLALAIGLLPWNFVSSAIGASTGSLLAQAGLLKKVYFPREYVVGATILSWLVTFAIEMSVLIAAVAITGKLAWQLLPLLAALVVLQTLLIFGYSLLLSALNVYFRDVQHLLGIAMQVWFYLTPIVYPITLIDESAEVFGVTLPLRQIYSVNPMVHVIGAYRDVLYHGRVPGWQSMTYLGAFASVLFVIGLSFFRRLEPRLAEEL